MLPALAFVTLAGLAWLVPLRTADAPRVLEMDRSDGGGVRGHRRAARE
jgi:hypothetical protein